MKKIININFQGRVIPIEESAYDILKQYVESLRKYFATEEGRDEIINDIESRIAELFNDRLKRGSSCITDDDVNAIIASMGRPEDFEAVEGETVNGNASADYSQSTTQQTSATGTSYSRGSLFRNADDKIIGGVCSGLANYLRIDPVIVRIFFVALFGALFWVYILLWVIVPSKSVQSNITKRLFRNANDKVIAGVCGGLASYFKIDTWIPRLVFALPFIIAIVSSSFNTVLWNWNWGWHFGPRIITGSLGSTLFIIYIILWIAVPYATTASEKLEMRGEKVDLNTIRDTVNDDLASMKTRAEKFGGEMKEAASNIGQKAQEFSSVAATKAKELGAEAGDTIRNRGSDLGSVLGTLFKIIFFIIAGFAAVILLSVLGGLIFGGIALYPLKNYFLAGFGENLLAWLVLVFFLLLPIVALVTWLVRRIMGVRSRNHYLGFAFGLLWVVGLISAIFLVASVVKDFRSRSGIDEEVLIKSPTSGKLFVEATVNPANYYDENWFGSDFDDMPFYGINKDSMMLRNVRINVLKSKDSFYHVYKVTFSRSENIEKAKELAERIQFNIVQHDSILTLPKGFAISRDEKFRNQQVLVIIEVPVGKKIELHKSVEDYEWFSLNVDRRRGRGGVNIRINEDDLNNTLRWNCNKEYVMTNNGLVHTRDLNRENDRRNRNNENTKRDWDDDNSNNDNKNNRNANTPDSSYRYKENKKVNSDSSNHTQTIQTGNVQAIIKSTEACELAVIESSKMHHPASPFMVLNELF